ncbi:DUF1983 domain-containing protein, partial [Stenotrophomonas lactitubi]|uniref:phage tail protein n=1 Tax=Stenotrophomonas lactitubi TaxID=2045214 RepID=UPI003207BAF8
PNRDNATKFADFAYPQNRYQLDGLAAGARFYFWGRLVDKSGNIGPWYPTGAGVMGQASTNLSEYEEYFRGKIVESSLGQDLLAKIESTSGLVPLIWTEGATHEPGQTVVYNGRIWLWNGPGNGNERPPGTKWTNVGDAIAESGALVGRMNQVEMDIGELDGKVLAQGKRIDGIFAQVDARGAGDTDGGAGDATAYAGVMSLQAVAAMDDYAMAKRTDTVEAKVGDTQAIVQQTSQAVVDMDGKVSASWNLKLQIAANGQYYAAGMGIGIENQPDGSYQSQILFQADRLALINVINGQVTTPFVVQGGQTFISQALIGVAWITTANIEDAAITNAKISGVIQSNDYVQGQTGWRINKAAGGGFEFNGTVAGGYRLNVTNQGVYVYHPNGVAAVEIGVLL